jgi:hypothetical protein
MCQDWLGSFGSTGRFLDHVKKRVAERRYRDGPVRDSSFRGGEPGSSPAPEKRGGADLCYAYNPKDGEFYVGYSGYSGGMTYQVPRTGTHKEVTLSGSTSQSERRQERFEREVDIGKGSLARPSCNCAEACALSIANSWNDDGVLKDLVFVTFYPENVKGGRVKAPCDNCMKWIKAARAYCNDSEKFYCRSDRDPGSGSGRDSTGSDDMITT